MGKENLRPMGSVDNSRGLELQFKQLPPLSESPIPFSVSSDPHKRLRLSEEVSVLLQKAAIEQVPTSSLGPGFYSRLFLVPKKKGGMRPVIDLSILNTYLVVPHFKMETNRSIRASMLPGMWSTSLDLTDAYFHCLISVAFRKYLRFEWDNKVFQFRALPFGLAIGPLVFTKLFQVVLAHLHYLSRFILTWTILLSRNSTQTFFCLIPRFLGRNRRSFRLRISFS
jgi:hypothetical protein